MSKRDFIVTALTLNLILCLIICLVTFVTGGDSDKKDSQTKQAVNVAVDETTSANETEGTTKDSEDETTKNANAPKRTTEDNIIYQQTTEEKTTVFEKDNTDNVTRETTTKREEPSTINKPFVADGQTATINSACNVRSQPNVSGEVIGTAKAGVTYQVDSSKMTNDWVPILFDGDVWGYISSGYCSVN